ncbi:64_t:CDS:10 [Entrophospora sp. SA101]|nr:15594_t:CDS:10 [Entrophospora sp. SA101]CAJ0754457.1 64_t:CDS:10 [Entrophospora sp. SA101]
MKAPTQNCAHSQVELKVSCKDLVDLDILSKSDPQILLSIKDPKTREWKPLCKTEVIENDLNPEFVTGFIVDYAFEELQELRQLEKFICVDIDEPKDTDWKHQDLIGEFECDLGSIVASEGGKMDGILTLPDHPGKKRGLITILAEEVSKSKRNLQLQFQARKIVNKGRFFRTKATTFLVISRKNESNNIFSPVNKSEVVSSSSPCWQELYIRESTLCNGDYDRELKLQVKQYKRNGEHVPLGECSVTLREIMENKKPFPLKLQPGSQRKVSKDANITIVKALVKEPPSFLDYIAGGTEIRLMVAIDFTGSNGDPRNPKSLHYSEAYDSDRLFPVYGFGAKFNGILSHVHPLNNNHQNPEVKGVEGILSVYSQTINTVELYGPTNFSPIINLTANKIETELKAGNTRSYYILLIITGNNDIGNGVITDMDLTVRAIVKASSLPLSIVIVGVGNANFAHMTRLDGDDDNPLSAKSDNKSLPKTTGRDIVQFIAMRDYQAEAAGYSLPKAVLEEIPDQFMDYMNKNKIHPKKRNIDKIRVNPRFFKSSKEPQPIYAHDAQVKS